MHRYWGRMNISGKWLMWHLIGECKNQSEARTKFMFNTRLKNSEVEITDIEPIKYAGKYSIKKGQ